MSTEASVKPNEKTKAADYLKGWLAYKNQRYVVFFIISAISLALPFITFDGNHIFLLSFDHKELHLAGVRFDMQELYLMPFLLIMMFLGIFFITTLAGRVWCGWGCPQTIFRSIYRDLFETWLLGMRRSTANKQKEPDMSKMENKLKKAIAILLWSVLAFVAAANFLWYFVPPEDFFTYVMNPAEHYPMMIFFLGIAFFLIFDVVMIKESFCVYMCPYSRVQSVLYDNDTIMTVYDWNRGGTIYDEKGSKLWKKPPEGEGECTGCESCVKVCPTHIDIRKGMQLECINCLECADACTKVMANFERPSLISWTSPQAIETKSRVKYFRFRTIAYMVVLSIVLVALVFMSGKKENMLLNINRTTQLYSAKPGNVVENSYIFLFQNTDRQDHTYYFEVTGHPEIEIYAPKEPVKLGAGKKTKEIVRLKTDKILVKDERKDTPIPITIKAYALDDKENIVVTRESVFIYPRLDQLKP